MRLIAITKQKGGCGKPTTAINLAASLAASGSRVLLVDLDPQAHASSGAGAQLEPHAKTLYHALSGSPEPTPLQETVVAVSGGFAVAPGHILLSTLEQELAQQEGGIGRLSHALAGLQQPYDIILIDTPPNLGFLTFNALRAANEVIVPIDISSFALKSELMVRLHARFAAEGIEINYPVRKLVYPLQDKVVSPQALPRDGE
jgi:chromosome partitioning protein